MKARFLYILPLLALFSSCKVDFSPNAAWKEVPVVYCVLDQDDDTTFVRVQKGYLGEDNLHSYSDIFDSINYPEGSIKVQLLRYPAHRVGGRLEPTGASPVVLDFEYALLDKEEGDFATPQPVYLRRTKGELDTSSVYQLLVLKSNGDTLASATTTLIAGEDNPFYLLKPTKLNFLPTHKCDFKWKALSNARLYQPMVRFYYDELEPIPNTDSMRVVATKFVDVNCSRVANTNNSPQLVVSLLESTFLLDIQNALKDDSAPKGFHDTSDVYLFACTEDLNAYLNTTDRDVSSTQDRQTYSNIQGGRGVFAARRTHLMVSIPDDDAVGSTRLHAQLKALNVGF